MITQHICITDTARLSPNNDLNPVHWSEDNSGLFCPLSIYGHIYKLQYWDLFPLEIQTLTKANKTGVWHSNSSQRIKDPFRLPPQSQRYTFTVTHENATFHLTWEVGNLKGNAPLKSAFRLGKSGEPHYPNFVIQDGCCEYQVSESCSSYCLLALLCICVSYKYSYTKYCPTAVCYSV